jgi:hypothetical protein
MNGLHGDVLAKRKLQVLCLLTVGLNDERALPSDR